MKLFIITYKTLLFLFIFNLSFSNLNETKFIYDVEIKGISVIAGNVGKCLLIFREDSLKTFNMNIKIQTTNLAKLLYPYTDEILIKTDSTFSLLSFNQTIKPSKKNVKVEVDTINKKITRNNKIQNFYSDSLYSPFSIIHLLRKQNLNINDEFRFNILSSKKIKKLILKVFQSEMISVPYGKFDSIRLRPISKDYKMKNNGQIEVWYSNDNKKLPLKIKLNSNIGTFIMKLKQVKND